MNLKSLLITCAVILPFTLVAQDYRFSGNHTFHLELFGPSLATIHYEKAWNQPSQRFHLLTGIGYSYLGASDHCPEGRERAHYLPLRLHGLYRVLSSKWGHHYLFAGPTFLVTDYKACEGPESKFTNASSGLNIGLTGDAGYRLQSTNGGTVFRFGISAVHSDLGNVPIYSEAIRKLHLLPIISIGYTFGRSG